MPPHEGGKVSERETLEAEIKKLSMKAVQAKMDLHDLSEELPVNWEQIPEVADRVFQLYKDLATKRAALKAIAG